ncbi:TIGR04255 family protein [Thermopolyspora sp. NPDC052614]|uniref:TIGR04255 family protein n=1 Tax=Thermopolyspora sp. NPDC052614 TaxID=3155682 RepID=UPI003418F169
MTGRSIDLPNKPLVEAILEIRWALDQNKDPAHPLYAGVLAGRLSEAFPYQENLPAAQIPDEITPHIVKFRFRAAPDSWPLIQAGPGIATLNLVGSYQWEAFRSLANYLWDKLHDSYAPFNSGNPPRITQLQLRYINAVPISGLDLPTFLKDKLHVSFAVPAEIASKHTNGPASEVLLNVAYPLNFEGTTGLIQLQSGKQNDVDSIVFNLIAITNLSSPATFDKFATWIEYVHGVLEEWFFTLIDGELLTEFRGEAIANEHS